MLASTHFCPFSLISWINPKEKTLTFVTKSWPDCDIKLDNNERESIMKNRDPNHEKTNSMESIVEWKNNDLAEKLQQ